MMEIKTIPIRTLVSKTTTWDPRKSNGTETFLYIDLSSIDRGTKSIADVQTLICSEAPSRARQLVQAGDVLVATVRPNLNGLAIVPPHLDGATASTGFTVLRPIPEMVDSRYLFHCLRTEEFVQAMVQRATGASYPAVTDNIVKDFSIPLRSLSDQRRIAHLLDLACSLGDNSSRFQKKLIDLINARFGQLFGDLSINASGWAVCQLHELMDKGDKINYGVIQPGDNTENGVPIVRAGDFGSLAIDVSNLKRISREIEGSYVRSRLKGHEILVCCVGATIGKIGVADMSVQGFNIARAVARLPVSRSRISRWYLACYLQTDLAQDYFAKQTRTVGQPTLNIKQLEEMPIVCPPRELQDQFELAVRASQSITDKLFESEMLADKLKDALYGGVFQASLEYAHA